ncbi:hypothetical protein B0H63DRAFT_87296 [Podospora didyma]|uniref:Uncharacterized protein n=1 Tax=Podospora didyma TaxID=330526 RepID=A0AAE0K1G4_9PEZI|nr:hypothetical protein B0H63DRAFT_87296 [Podospora didyma]
MSDTLHLVGVIGTWVALGLGIIALAGVLPTYLLVKQSRTERAKALALVDNPDHVFVSKGFRLWGVRVNQKVRVPDLTRPPNISMLAAVRPDLTKLPPRRPTTGWVDFARIIIATFPEVAPMGDDHYLVFEDGQSHLLIHPAWMVILSVLHRYSYRPDFGLPLGSAEDNDLDGRDPLLYLSGLSGILTVDDDFRTREVSFETHSPEHLNRSLAEQEMTSLRRLLLLFMGYIEATPGRLISADKQLHRDRSGRPRRARTFRRKLRIVTVRNKDVARRDVRLGRDLELGLTRTDALVINNPSTVLEDDVLALPLDPDRMRSLGYTQIGRWKRERYDEVMNLWISSLDVHRIVRVCLEVPLSPHGRLYDIREDFIVNRALKARGGLNKAFTLVKKWMPSRRASPGTVAVLEEAMSAVTDLDLADITWRRHATQSFNALDKNLEAACTTNNVGWKTTRLLYAIDDEFRTKIWGLLSDPPGDDNTGHVHFSDLAKQVEVRKSARGSGRIASDIVWFLGCVHGTTDT